MKGAQRRADKCRVFFSVIVYRLSRKAFYPGKKIEPR
jgi:hypothetical protein